MTVKLAICGIFFLSGRDTEYSPFYDDFPITSKMVLTLIDELLDKGYCLYTDNFYTSSNLVDYLAQRQTDTVGTLKTKQNKGAKISQGGKAEEG